MKLRHRRPDNFYITFLEYATKKMGSGDGTVDYTDVFQHVHSIHSDVSEDAFKRIFLQTVASIEPLGRAVRAEDIDSGVSMVLTIEAYFQLLEHRELQEARKASSWARNLALVAIAIAALSVVLSAILQVFGSNDAVIDAAQYQGIIDAIQAK